MPFIKNSTATSGLPFAARRHAITEASGNPRALRLFTTSAGNSLGELTSDAAAAGAGVVVDAAAAVEDDAAAGAAGVLAVVVVAGVLGAAAAGFGAGAFLAFINQPNDICLSVRN